MRPPAATCGPPHVRRPARFLRSFHAQHTTVRIPQDQPPRSHHVSLLYRIGNFAGRHPWRVIGAWVFLAGRGPHAQLLPGGGYDETFRLPGSESQAAADAIQDRFPQETLYTSNVVLHSEEGLTSPATRAAVEQAVQKLAEGPHVVAVSSPYDPRGPTVSADGQTAFATVGFDPRRSAAEYDAAEKAVQGVRDAGIQVEYDGGLGYAKVSGGGNSEMIGILMAVIVLAIAFGSLVAMSLPIVAALTAIVIGSSAVGILAGFVAVPEVAGVVAIMLGLGVGIDYALFILSRHRQNLAAGLSVPVAIGRANATAGLSVLFAGVTVIVAILGLKVAGIPMMTMMGYGSAVMVAVVMLAAITLLPAMLGVVKHRVNSARVPFIRPQPAYDPDAASARWAARVVARPVRYGGAAALALGILAIPVFSMHLGFADAGNDAPTSTTRKAYDLIADGYGPGTNGPFQVVVDADGGTSPHDPRTASRPALADQPGVASVDAPVTNRGGDLAVVTVTPTTAPQDERTSELLQQLREDTIPAAVDGTDVEASVTGATALTVRRVVAAAAADALVPRRRDRAVVPGPDGRVPLGAGAAQGRRAQRARRRRGVRRRRRGLPVGLGASLIGVHETVPIMPLAPMLMFAILFGLSMDYEVFLMSRSASSTASTSTPAVPWSRASVDRSGHHQRRAHHDQRVRLLHPRRRRDDQDVRHRPVGRRLPGRDAGPDDPGPGGDEPARSPGLVAAGVARPSPADDRHRRRRARR